MLPTTRTFDWLMPNSKQWRLFISSPDIFWITSKYVNVWNFSKFYSSICQYRRPGTLTLISRSPNSPSIQQVLSDSENAHIHNTLWVRQTDLYWRHELNWFGDGRISFLKKNGWWIKLNVLTSVIMLLGPNLVTVGVSSIISVIAMAGGGTVPIKISVVIV